MIIMKTEILRIIEGGLANDKRKVVSYSIRLADQLSIEGNESLAGCIRKKIEEANLSHSGVVHDALRNIPLDSDSRLHIVEVIPPTGSEVKIVLSPIVQQQVEEFVNIVTHASQLETQGVNIPKTLILYGQPGCGKTSIAHYVSQMTGLPLVLAKLDSLVSSLLGSTAKNIRKIFDYVSDFPCILFLDEFDAIAKARDDQKEIGELKRVINSLLQNIDSMPRHCILIAATNHPELLDKAVWRRFLQKVEVSMPTKSQIVELVHLFAGNTDQQFINQTLGTKRVIEMFDGYSPAEIKNLFDRAKIKSILEGKPGISFSHLVFGIYELQNGEKSQEGYIRFLKNKGFTQRFINELTGISLRQIKNITANNA